MEKVEGPVVIRKAREVDVESIASVSESVALERVRTGCDGFIIFPLTIDKIIERLKLGVVLNVIVLSGNVIGYIMAYNLNHLLKLEELGELNHEEQIIKLLKTKNEPFLYIEQIAIKRGLTRQGFGQMLFDDYIKKLSGKYKNVFATLVKKPVKNDASLAFFKKNGFKLVKNFVLLNGEFTVGLYKFSL